MADYDHRAIEQKWQAHWEAANSFATPANRTRPKFYVLDMFPYPSGNGLHVGHPKGYVATDVVARIKRMLGFNVLHPMGWDSFGLPTERQAVREGLSPQEVTRRNIQTFRKQLQRLGLSYDWQRELATSEADYYRWTQWIFLKLYERGLAYQAEAAVHWCPAQGTVLANEEVLDGRYIETGDPVEPRMMRQWMLKITDYAESLLAGLDSLDWPEGIKAMQRHWIGRSEGASVQFRVAGSSAQISVFTTRPDTLFGCSAMVLAPEHALLAQLVTDEQRAKVADYREKTARLSERERIAGAADDEKTGVFTGAWAINPINEQRVPIWIADYVLSSYGSGAIFSCPAHDERDYKFARKFDLPITPVVAGGNIDEGAWTGDGEHIHSGFLNGLNNAEAKARAIGWLEENLCGSRQITYRLRDWLFSRQRYWGEPIPIIHTATGPVPVPQNDLPITLPELDEYKPTEDGDPPLSRSKSWVSATTSDGVAGLRETSTMPQWAGSCWYYLRFINPKLTDRPWDSVEEHYWMPVDLYVGGAEHATLHLLYARFWHHVLNDLGMVSTREPFVRLFNQGMVYGDSYRDAAGRYYYRDSVHQNKEGSWVTLDDGRPVTTRKEKMSKSRYNVVNPEDICETYGADALRLYELFMGALEDNCDWETRGVAGCRRFLDRTFRLVTQGSLTREPIQDREVERALHLAIQGVVESLDTLKFNTAIAKMMTFVNVATRARRLHAQWLEDFLSILSPFAPHIAAELWQRLGHEESLEQRPFPVFDENKVRSEVVTLAVQVKGKLRGTVEVASGASQNEIIEEILAQQKFQRLLGHRPPQKTFHVPGRLVNLIPAEG